MGSLKIRIQVSASGPLADGTAHQAVLDWADESKAKTADYALGQLRAVQMDKTGRATGHYQSGLRSQVLTYNDMLVDDPVIYGPWLEGTSERNRSTRFKGYALWRRAKQATAKQAPQIARELLPRYAERIGGGE